MSYKYRLLSYNPWEDDSAWIVAIYDAVEEVIEAAKQRVRDHPYRAYKQYDFTSDQCTNLFDEKPGRLIKIAKQYKDEETIYISRVRTQIVS
jgi:hypothetical protein